MLRNPHEVGGEGGATPAEHNVVGTGWSAALSSFCFFASGAAIPVLPFMLGWHGPVALVIASILVGLALMLTGATVGVLSGGPPSLRALRQLGIGAVTAGATYGLGVLFGSLTG